MLRWLTIAMLASLTTGGLSASAQEKPPAAPDAPAAAEAEKPPVNPEELALRATLKSLAKALQEGDGERIRSAMYAANPTEKKMLDAMAGMAVQIAALHKASAKVFGDEEAKALTGEIAIEMGRIDEAEISIDGDAATVRYAQPATAEAPATAAAAESDSDPPPASPPMVLKKVDGHWRVPIAELSKDTTPDEIDQRLADLDAQAKIITELSAEIAQGKYKSAEKAAEAWQGKMMQALVPKKPDDQKPAGDKDADAEKPK